MWNKEKNPAQRLLAAAGITEENRSRFVIACIGLVGAAVLTAYGLLTCFDGDAEADRHLMYAACAIFWAIGVGCILLQRSFRVQGLMIFAQMLALGLMVRFMMLHGVSGDYTCYWQPWLETMRGLDVRQALVQEIGNYTMPYTYFLVWVSRLSFQELFCIKLLSILFDVLCGVMLVALARQAGFGQKGRLAVFFLYMFLPPFFLNSAYWAQCDSVYVFFCLAALYYALQGRSAACWALIGAAFALKLQAVFLLPVLFVLLLTKKLKWRWLPLAPLQLFGAEYSGPACGAHLWQYFCHLSGAGRGFQQADHECGHLLGAFPRGYGRDVRGRAVCRGRGGAAGVFLSLRRSLCPNGYPPVFGVCDAGMLLGSIPAADDARALLLSARGADAFVCADLSQALVAAGDPVLYHVYALFGVFVQ